jgi:uncharacterized membrane protein YidH (DUF202 family)
MGDVAPGASGDLDVRHSTRHPLARHRFEEINIVNDELTNDELANNRTFLAWLRTGIACFGLGFVVAKAALIINAGGKPVPYKDLYSFTGVLIVLGGAALVVAGCWQHRHVLRALRSGAAKPMPHWPIIMTVVAVVGGLALSVLIAIST